MLSEREADEIYQMEQQGCKAKEIAEIFGYNRRDIMETLRGLTKTGQENQYKKVLGSLKSVIKDIDSGDLDYKYINSWISVWYARELIKNIEEGDDGSN